MCGRYTLRRIDVLASVFRAERIASAEEFSETRIVPRFNIAPSQQVPVIRLNSAGARVIDLVRWGLVPGWVKGKPKLAPINARAETIATSGMFRHAFQQRRCLERNVSPSVRATAMPRAG